MLITDLNFSRLTEKTVVSSFDCGDADLNDFFRLDALQYKHELLAATYCFENTENEVVCFFSVSNDSLIDKDFEKWNKLSRKISNRKRRRDYPAVKIGRLGVHNEYRGYNIGGQTLTFIKGWLAFNNNTGCRFLLVDAYNRPEIIRFYERNDFATVTQKDETKRTRLMYFDLMKVTQD